MSEEGFDHALVTLLWQGHIWLEDENEEPESVEDHYDTDAIPDDVKAEIREAWETFYAKASDILAEYDPDGELLWADEEQIGHDWVLTSFRHGAGFWDRYYGDQVGTKVGKILTELSHLEPCPEVQFELEGGWFG